MTNILELIKNEKVEWKKLGEVCENRFWMMPATPKFISQQGIPYITGKNIKQGKIDYSNVKYITEEDFNQISKNRELQIDDVLISMIGTIGEIGIIRENIKFYGQNLYVLRLDKSQIMNMYFYYYFSQGVVKNSLISQKNNSSQGYIRAGQLESLEIPIPSLEIQEKIVKILDKFTNYVTELQSELQSRTKQYTYYRDKLLSEEYLTKVTKEMEEDRRLNIFKLDEIFDFKNGLNKGKEYFGKGVPFVSYVNVYKLDRLQEEDIVEKVDLTEDEIERFSVIKGDVLFTRTSEVKEEVGYSSVVIENLKDTVFNGFTIRARLKNRDLLLPEYSAHLFRCHEIRKEIIKRSSFTTRASLSGQELGKVKVVIPPLSLQNKIVKVLDKFQVLLSDTKGLIPEEIDQRQKQYEYYREKLLTFDEVSDRFDSIRFDS